MRFRKTESAATRFERLYVPEPMSGCWLWIGATTYGGYGTFHDEGSRVAHRWSYIHHRGSIPPGLVIDHLCRTPGCVNPQHLEAVSERVNILRSNAFSARNARRTHCGYGHLLSPENTYSRPGTNWRACRACLSRRHKEWKRAVH